MLSRPAASLRESFPQARHSHATKKQVDTQALTRTFPYCIPPPLHSESVGLLTLRVGGELLECTDEGARVLGPREDWLAVDDEIRHPAHPSPAVPRRFLRDRLLVLARLQDGAGLVGVEADASGEGGEVVDVGVEPVGEVAPEDRLLQLVLRPRPLRFQHMLQQAVSPERVGRSVALAREVDPDIHSHLLHSRPDTRVVWRVGGLRDTLTRMVGTKKKRPPLHGHVVHPGGLLNRRFHLPLSHPAPWSHDITDYLHPNEFLAAGHGQSTASEACTG
mmetsp:Transcript_32922/g.66844  ORF Transcript_32922/g.66844 Transcript_32922/m.66844 type:complete len:276 (+) Transcript_32922:92-919(+)